MQKEEFILQCLCHHKHNFISLYQEKKSHFCIGTFFLFFFFGFLTLKDTLSFQRLHLFSLIILLSCWIIYQPHCKDEHCVRKKWFGSISMCHYLLWTLHIALYGLFHYHITTLYFPTSIFKWKMHAISMHDINYIILRCFNTQKGLNFSHRFASKVISVKNECKRIMDCHMIIDENTRRKVRKSKLWVAH